ncbi:uncharacterized protein [Argopecten irradians]|uniref:uncharacterized protein n=1 Tax=Argopecten irradians TaxID=31199 RepID=UPI00371B8CBA
MSNVGAQMQTEIRCPSHSTVDVMFVCLEDECKEALACPRCILDSGGHFKHNLALLDDHLDKFKKRIYEYNTQTRTEILVPLQKSAKQVVDDLKGLDPNAVKLIQDIGTREDKIISHTKALGAELKRQCSITQDANRQKLEQYRDRVMARITEVETDVAALESCLAENRRADIANAATTSLNKTYERVDTPDIQEIVFKESETSCHQLGTLLGVLVIGNEEHEREETDVEKIKRLEEENEEMIKKTKMQVQTNKRLEAENMDLVQRTKMQAQTNKRLEAENMDLVQR